MLPNNTGDDFSWRLSLNGVFSIKSFYLHLNQPLQPSHAHSSQDTVLLCVWHSWTILLIRSNFFKRGWINHNPSVLWQSSPEQWVICFWPAPQIVRQMIQNPQKPASNHAGFDLNRKPKEKSPAPINVWNTYVITFCWLIWDKHNKSPSILVPPDLMGSTAVTPSLPNFGSHIYSNSRCRRPNYTSQL